MEKRKEAGDLEQENLELRDKLETFRSRELEMAEEDLHERSLLVNTLHQERQEKALLSAQLLALRTAAESSSQESVARYECPPTPACPTALDELQRKSRMLEELTAGLLGFERESEIKSNQKIEREGE